MKLPGALVKAGLTTAATGVYLYFKKVFKRKKKTKKDTVKNKNAKPTRAVKKPTAKPRQKKLQPVEDLPMK
jgi:hypothetical protein